MDDRRRLIALSFLILGILWVIQGALTVKGAGDDWKIFWNAAHYVGTPELLSRARFAYTPGVAWALWLIGGFSRTASYFIYSAFMLCCAFLASFLASRVYRLPVLVTSAMLVAWFPLTIAVCLGQNTPFGLLLVMLAIYAFVRRDETLLGLAVGLSFYKPTVGIPLFVLLVVFQQRKATCIVAVTLVIWYALSAAAVHDALWPRPYIHMLSSLYNYDRAVDGDYAIGIPGILIHVGLSPIEGWVLAIVSLVSCAMLLTRTSRIEAATMLPAIALATAPHAYGYDALLMLPVLWLLVTSATPKRIAVAVAAFIVAPMYVFSRVIHFDPLALPVIGFTAAWVVNRLREDPRGEAAI